MNKDKSKKIIKMSDIKPPIERTVPSFEEEAVKPESVLPKEEIEFEERIELEEKIEPEIPETIEEEPFLEEFALPVTPEEKEERVFPEDLFAPKTKRGKKRIFITMGIACIIVLMFIFYFTLSKAEVIIKAKTETMKFQTELNLDKNIAFTDLEGNKIPAQLFQVEKEGQREFPATQEKELKEKARGIITIYNQYSSAPQTLVKNTRLVSEKGELFRTNETIVIPGAKVEEGKIIPSTIDVEVMAAEPGKEYNIGPSSFTIPGFEGTAKYTGFYGKSTQPMKGGVVGKVKVVSAEDISGAKDILAVELKQEAKEELEKRIPADLKILEDTTLVEIVDSISNAEDNQAMEKFEVTVKVRAKVLGFNEDDAISLINDNLKTKISENKALISDTIKIAYTIADINLDKGTVRLICEVNEDIAWKVDGEKIKRELAGKNEVEVRRYLGSLSEIENAKVIFWPFWVKKIPSNEEDIKITID